MWSDDLEGEHYRIAASEASRISVLAGPGTGKTGYGLIRRVARLLESGISGDEILLLSFTRTAARDLRDKVSNMGVDGSESVRATTLHSYCFSLLQRESVLSITGRVPRILLNHEVDLMLRDLEGEFRSIYDKRRHLRAFEAGWARLQQDYPGMAELPLDREFERGVMNWLKHHRAMLVGEVVPLAYKFLQQNPMNAEIERFTHVLVDEYQDLNYLEQQLIQKLGSSPNSSLCVVGDDDQSIYSFRYANPDGILRVSRDEKFEQHQITVCGRCPNPILSISNSLINWAPNRNKPPLTARDESKTGYLAIIQWATLDAEIEGIAAAIVDDIQSERFEPGDILVLVHRQEIGRSISRALQALGVVSLSYFSQEALDNNEARRRLALFRLSLANDLPSLRVLLGLGDGDGRSAAYKRLVEFAAKIEKSEIEVLELILRGVKLHLRIPAIVQRFREAKVFIEALAIEDLDQLVETIFPAGVDGLEDIRPIALECARNSRTAAELCERIVIRISQEDVPEHPDFVRIMSLHKSKGLTSKCVYIVSALNGIIPTIRGTLTEQEERASYDEQRRLMYVAITRAAEQLVISSCLSIPLARAYKLGVETAGNRGGTGNLAMVASPYLQELGSDAPTAMRGDEWLAARQ